MFIIFSFFMFIWRALWGLVWFWAGKATSALFGPSRLEIWSRVLRNASNYDEWAEAADNLDFTLGLDMWRRNPTSKDYDYRLIKERLRLITAARREGDVYDLINTLRTGLVRNLGNITSSKLFNSSFAGTKFIIEEYVQQYVEAIQEIAVLPPSAKDAELPAAEIHVPEYEDGEVSGTGGSGGAGGGGGGGGGGRRRRRVDDDRETTAGTAAICSRPCQGGMATATIPTQHKLDFIHDTRQGYGRTALVLQGGAIFGLCHLGVVKALLLQGLLPRIIIGTATGAMMAAMVGVHTTEELLRILTKDEIDLSAFASKNKDPDSHDQQAKQSMWTRWATLTRRVQRFRKEGYFLDVKVLEECVRANIGDLTFEEAFNKSKRILNITVVPAGQEGIPTLLNYVTAPNVLVWTAAVASNASSSTFYGPRHTKILCKDAQGNVKPWAPTDTVDFRHWTSASYTDRTAPLQRVAGLFNVNHYIVSQARPYLIPFLQNDMHGPPSPSSWSWTQIRSRSRSRPRSSSPTSSTRNRRRHRRNSNHTANPTPASVTTSSVLAFLTRMIGLETRHRLRQLDRMHLLPPSIRRFLVDEHLPGPSVTLVPQISLLRGDFARLMETPTRETLRYWMLRGERSVWPAVAALRVRCAIEMELDRVYQDVRRLKAGDLRRRASGVGITTATATTAAAAVGLGPGRKRGPGEEGEEGNSSGGSGRPRAWSIGARRPSVARSVV